jgi:hypothetical protein
MQKPIIAKGSASMSTTQSNTYAANLTKIIFGPSSNISDL